MHFAPAVAREKDDRNPMLKSRTNRCFGPEGGARAKAWRPSAGVPGVVRRLSRLGSGASMLVGGAQGRPRAIEVAAIKDRLRTTT